MNKSWEIDISIIIVNFNSIDDILRCITSVLKKSSSDTSYEIIVCSNSKEKQTAIDSITCLSNNISFLEMPGNLGFAKANNRGAIHAKGEYLFFLNPDTELLNDALSKMLFKLKNYPQIGLIGAALINSVGDPYDSVRSDISTLNLLTLAIPFGRFFFKKKNYFPYSPKESSFVDIVEGSAMFISSRLFNKIGGMNEKYFMYCEERDLCLKIRMENLNILYQNDVKIRHIGGTSTSPYLLKMEIEKQKSLKKYISEHHRRHMFLYYLCYIIGYFWRTVLALLTFNKSKARQFSTILKWYLFDWHKIDSI